MLNKRRGFIYLLVAAAVLAAVTFSLTLSNLNQGFRRQVNHVAHKDVCFEMAYSVLSGLQSKVYTKPWSERFFAAGAVSVSGKTIFDAKYDYLIENSPGKANHFDAYIRIDLAGKKRLYFWRIHYLDNILDISQSFSKIYFTTLDPDKFPVGSVNRIAGEVDQMLANRLANKEKAAALTSVLKGLNNTKDIADVLNAPKPDFPSNDFPEFNPIEPRAPEIPEIPGVQPPMTSERPKEPYTGGGTANPTGGFATLPEVPPDPKEKLDQYLQGLQTNSLQVGNAKDSTGTGEGQSLESGTLSQANESLRAGLNNATALLGEAQNYITDFSSITPGSQALLEQAKIAASYIERGTEAYTKMIESNNAMLETFAAELEAMNSPDMTEEEAAAYAAKQAEFEQLKAENEKIREECNVALNKALEEYKSTLQGLVDRFPEDPGWTSFGEYVGVSANK